MADFDDAISGFGRDVISGRFGRLGAAFNQRRQIIQ
jgi:hypothetical protein